jgi:hypothetical protein
MKGKKYQKVKLWGRVSGKAEYCFTGHAEPGTTFGIGANRLLGVDVLLSAALSGAVKSCCISCNAGDYLLTPRCSRLNELSLDGV